MSDINAGQYLERARLLLKQKRYKDAEQQAAILLQQQPGNVQALQVIGHCKLETKQYAEALRLFKECIGREPDDDYLHYLLAFTYYRMGSKDEVISALKEAIAINPYASAYYALYAYIMLDMKWYDLALEKANEGLAVNAADISCLNARSQALFRLNNKEAAYETIKEALNIDPEDDFTHTNYGWHFLERGKHKDAREHFRMALRINPNNSRARQGYKESLKAKLPPYRWMVMFSLWLSTKSKRARWIIIFVIWISVKLLSDTSSAAGFGILAYILIGLYLLFVTFSWVGTPLANIMLFLSSEGKYVLTQREKTITFSVAGCIAAGIALMFIGFHLPALQKDDAQLLPGIIMLSLILPVSRFDFFERFKKPKLVMICTIALLLWGIAAITALLLGGSDTLSVGFIYLGALAIYTWTFAAAA
jgi:tetratricopeptide (TPR) repeat protein